MNEKKCIVFILSLILFASPAYGAVTELTSPSDFSSSATTITFDDLSVATHVNTQYSALGVVFLDDSSRTPLIVNSYNRGGAATASEPNALFNDADYPGTSAKLPLVITFNKPVRKAGMFIGNGKRSLLKGVLTAYGSRGEVIGSVSRSVPDPVTGFIGLKADTDIYKLTLDYGDTTLGEEIDNLMFEGQAGTVVTVSPSNPTKNDRVTITAQNSDKNVRSIEIWVNKEKVKVCETSPCVFTGGPYNMASFEYWAETYDLQGVKSRSEISIVKIIDFNLLDIVKPTVSASHSPFNPSSSQTVTFTATASDAGGIHRLLIWVDGSYVADCYDSETCTYTGGPYTGRVRYFGYAIDNAGNYKATDYKHVDIGPTDTTRPTVSVSHTPYNPSSSQTVTFTATASDPSGIKRLLIWVDGSYVKECPGSPCTYTGGPYTGPRVKYFAYAIDNYDNYKATDYKYLYVGPRDTTLPEVYALHSSLYPTHSQQVTFTAKATDNHASGIDHIWLWVDGSYVKRCDSDECSFTGGPYAKDNIKYFALAYDKSGNRGFSGYIDFTVGPYSGNTVPIFHTGDSRTRVDVVFIPSTEYDANRSEFYDNVRSVIESAYYQSDPIFLNRKKFNFYYYKNSVNVGTKTVPGVGGTLCDWSSPSGWGGVTFSDSGAIIHKFNCRDSAGGGLFSSEWNSYRTFVHESGHSVFGIADEYCCDSYYYEPTPYPNLWSSRTRCRDAATSNGWDPDDCRQLTSGTSSISWWRWDPDPDIMNGGWTFNNADQRNVNWLFSECSAGRC